MNRTYEYRLRVSRSGHERLAALVEGQRLLYNAALQERRDAYRLAGKTITLYDQMRSLTECRRDLPDMAAVPVKLQRGTLRRVDRAYKAFFRRCKAGGKPGFPRFKGYGRFHTLEWAEPGGIRFDAGSGRLTSAAFGTLRARVHRPLPDDASIKAVRLVRDVKGWKVQLAVRTAAPAKRPVRTATGLDFGLSHLATLSNGERIANPRAGRDAAAVLRRRQRHLARCRRGSKGRRRAVAGVQRAHAKAANVRRTWHRQQAARLVKRFDLVALEDLNVKGLARGMHAKAVHDAGWGHFAKAIADKAESAGSSVVFVDARGTTQDCSGCGAVVPKTLAERWHSCGCGVSMDRDENAARNVLNRAVVRPGGRNVGAVGPCVLAITVGARAAA